MAPDAGEGGEALEVDPVLMIEPEPGAVSTEEVLFFLVRLTAPPPLPWCSCGALPLVLATLLIGPAPGAEVEPGGGTLPASDELLVRTRDMPGGG